MILKDYIFFHIQTTNLLEKKYSNLLTNLIYKENQKREHRRMAHENKDKMVATQFETGVGWNIVPSLIGKGGSGIKKILRDTWSLYNTSQASEFRVDEEKPHLRIELVYQGGHIVANIATQSETMMKLAKMAISDAIEEIKRKSTLVSHTFVFECPERLMGLLVGKKFSNIKRILNNSIYDRDGDSKLMDEDVETAKKCRLSPPDKLIKSLNETATVENLLSKTEPDNVSYIGWEPGTDEDYKEHLALRLTFNPKSDAMKDYPTFIEKLTESISSTVDFIIKKDNSIQERNMEKIGECLGM